MKSIIFLRQYGAYQKGQIAGFPPAQADAIIAQKAAKEYIKAELPTRKGADVPVKKG
jgi:hypothetical protein